MVIALLSVGCTLISDKAILAKFTDPTGDSSVLDSADTAGATDSGTSVDADGDGYSGSQGDCDDADPSVNPGATEDCSTPADDNCDGSTDDLNAVGCATFYADADGDGYGGLAGACLCVASAVFSLATSDDCDDGNAAVNPGAAEVCEDGIDNNCDGSADQCGPASGSLTTAVAYVGEVATPESGAAVAGLGDVNADGYDDVLVGAGYNPGPGAAYLVLGSAAPASGDLSAGPTYTGNGSSSERAGCAVAGVGDINGDGYDDAVVGAWDNARGGENAGAAYVLLGGSIPASASLGSEITFLGPAGDEAGFSVSGAGDVNADGLGDLLIGALGDMAGGHDAGTPAGAAFLVLGSPNPSGGALPDAAIRYVGSTDRDEAGSSVGGGGDVDGDGYDDIIVGGDLNSDGGSDAGAAFLMLGTASPSDADLSDAIEYEGEAAGDEAGNAVANAGDANSDGYDDILIGASAAESGSGEAYLVLGGAAPTATSLSAAIKFSGAVVFDYAGSSVSAAGDLDQDGYGDMLVGAPGSDSGGNDAGAAFVVLGGSTLASGTLTSDIELSGAAGDYAGFAVSGAGDVDGDGYLDVVVGAPFAGGDAGAAYFVLGTGM